MDLIWSSQAVFFSKYVHFTKIYGFVAKDMFSCSKRSALIGRICCTCGMAIHGYFEQFPAAGYLPICHSSDRCVVAAVALKYVTSCQLNECFSSIVYKQRAITQFSGQSSLFRKVKKLWRICEHFLFNIRPGWRVILANLSGFSRLAENSRSSHAFSYLHPFRTFPYFLAQSSQDWSSRHVKWPYLQKIVLTVQWLWGLRDQYETFRI